MIFYSIEKNLVVNSSKTKKIIARFEDGKFETKDPVLITKLKPHFRNDGVDYKSLNYWKMRELAGKKGMNYHKVKKTDLIKALEESEING